MVNKRDRGDSDVGAHDDDDDDDDDDDGGGGGMMMMVMRINMKRQQNQ